MPDSRRDQGFAIRVVQSTGRHGRVPSGRDIHRAEYFRSMGLAVLSFSDRSEGCSSGCNIRSERLGARMRLVDGGRASYR